MTFENVPWMVKGGRHSAAVGRMATHTGSEGVLGPLDLRVVPTAPTTSGQVKIEAGGARLINRYPNQRNESYVGRNVGDELVTIAATTTSSRVDLIVARIDDPEFGGQVPADPLVGPYFEPQVIAGVPAGTDSARDLNLAYPAIALARIEIPSGTSAITAGMIKDVRKVSEPKTRRYLRSHALVSGETDVLDHITAGYEEWPNNPGWTVDVPEWATAARIVATLGSIKYPPGSAYGVLVGRVGSTASGIYATTQEVSWDTPGVANNTRDTIVVADTIDIPASLRGTTQVVNIMGKTLAGTAYPFLDGGSSAAFDVEFVEQASSA